MIAWNHEGDREKSVNKHQYCHAHTVMDAITGGQRLYIGNGSINSLSSPHFHPVMNKRFNETIIFRFNDKCRSRLRTH